MDRIVLRNIPFQLTFEDVRARLCLEEEDDVLLMQEKFTQAMAIARPKAVARPCQVESIEGDRVVIDGHAFQSEVLARNLAGASTVYAYVNTCGTEVDDWSHQETDPIVGLWLDMLKEMILGQARGHFLDTVRGKVEGANLAAMSPGSGNLDVWPIEQQRGLFALIGDVEQDTGVRLTKSCLMLPTKSVSGILFPSETPFITCSLCSRLHCPNRRAPYQED